jgi:uncharacterized protein
MKYLVVVVVVLVVAWLLLRSGKRAAPPAAKTAAAPKPATAQAMLQCSHCGVHLPRAEAMQDERGVFCSEAHRLAGPRGG